MSPSGDAQRQIEKDAGLYVPQDKHLCFAAPYESTGVVSKRSSSWKEWVSLGPLRPQQIFYLFVMHTLELVFFRVLPILEWLARCTEQQISPLRCGRSTKTRWLVTWESQS